MTVVNIHDAKTRLSGLLAEVEKNGRRFVICRNGEPIADLIPHQTEVPMTSDKRLGAIKLKYDPIEEVSESEWPSDSR